MTEQTASREAIQLNRDLLVGGGVLVTLGGLLGFAGMALIQLRVDLGHPPVGRATWSSRRARSCRRRWEQTKAAAAAGAAAWRDGPPSERA